MKQKGLLKRFIYKWYKGGLAMFLFKLTSVMFGVLLCLGLFGLLHVRHTPWADWACALGWAAVAGFGFWGIHGLAPALPQGVSEAEYEAALRCLPIYESYRALVGQVLAASGLICLLVWLICRVARLRCQRGLWAFFAFCGQALCFWAGLALFLQGFTQMYESGVFYAIPALMLFSAAALCWPYALCLAWRRLIHPKRKARKGPKIYKGETTYALRNTG